MTSHRALMVLALFAAAAVARVGPALARERVVGPAFGRAHLHSHAARLRGGRPHGGFSGAMSAAGIARNLGY